MKDYTNKNPSFFDTIKITETDDPDHADVINKAPIQIFQNTLVNKKMIEMLEQNMNAAAEFNSEKIYHSGNYCLYNGFLYKCLKDTNGEWNAESWKSTNILQEINVIQKQLDEVFRSGSENKEQLVENLTALGITASTDETWEILLDKVSNLMNTSNDTVTTEVLLSGYTAHNAAGTKITGTLADKAGTTDYNAEASIDGTNKRIKLKVPATGKYGVGNYLYAAYTTIANLIGLTAAKLVKGNTILGITGNNNNMDTSGADAGAGDILAGKKAGVKGSLITGTLADKTGTADHSAEASIDATNKRIKLKVPATGKYGVGNYLYAAYTTIANLIGLTAAKLVKGNTILGITGNNNNMDTSGADAGAGDILAGKKAGVKGSLITGTMTDRGAWIGQTTGNGNVAIPGGRHNGQGYVSGVGAYNKGITDADNRVNTNSANYKGGYNAGVSAADGRVNADSANYKGGYNAGVSATKKGTAGAGDVLSGKTFTNGSSVGASGTMANKGSTTQDATATQDDTYTYLTVPVAGYYNTASKLRTKNSNLAGVYYLGTGTSFDIKSKFPDDYHRFTADNFIVGGSSGNVVAAKSYTDGISGIPVARANGFSISKSYDAQTGILTVSGNTQQIRQGYDKAVNITYGNAAQTIETSCWLVIGEIQQP